MELEKTRTGTMRVARVVYLTQFMPGRNGDGPQTAKISLDGGEYPVIEIKNPYGEGLSPWIVLAEEHEKGKIIGLAEEPLSRKDGVQLLM
jgi:hypothetical protein